MTSLISSLVVCALGLSQCLSSAAASPTIDLGYALQQPTFLNTQYDLYVFYDIRYAASPSGPNRFRAPQPPNVNRTEVQTGGQQVICAQASPGWQATTSQFVPEYRAGKTRFEPSDFSPSPPPVTTPDNRTSEDCLFLDLYVPRTVLENANESEGVPVFLQIYGGGYVAGAKDLNPAGFFLRDQEQNGTGIIFVSINYRLGAFGWLASSAFQEDGGDANAGLLDQRFALEWVQEHISKFGGNPKNVTVIGESAGGGSIMHQITAFGGEKGVAPFQKAIIQSPGFEPMLDDEERKDVYEDFLRLMNVSTLAEARDLSFDDVYAANAKQIYNSSYGTFTYGPAVDGCFVPDLPSKLLKDGKFDHDVDVMVGHNADEGLVFISPFVQNDTSFKQDIGSWLPPSIATPTNMDYINSTLYPPVFDGSHSYTNQLGRTDVALSELVFTCNTFYLDKAFLNKTHAYYFAVPPANHGFDVGFTYYSGANTTDPQVQVALNMQRYFVNFGKTGNPNRQDLPDWPEYGDAAMVKVFNVTGDLRMQRDDVANGRCNWWQENLSATERNPPVGGIGESAAMRSDASRSKNCVSNAVIILSMLYSVV